MALSLFKGGNITNDPPFAPTYDYFLDFDESAFAEMEITLGPCISDGGRVIVDTLKNKFNKTAIVKDSILTGKIK